MFKKHSLQVQVVKNPKPKKASDDKSMTMTLDPVWISNTVKDQVQNLAIAVGGVYAASKILNTVSEIAIITAKAKIR